MKLRFAGLYIALSGAVFSAVDDKDAVFTDPCLILTQKSIPHPIGDAWTTLDIPMEHRLCGELVHVLPTGPRAFGIAKL